MSSSGTAGGISSQPYRTYLQDRNHFYQSAAVPHPSGPISSISANNSAISYSAVPTQQTSPQNSPAKKSSSHTSLNSGSSLQKMTTKRSSTTSSTMPIDSERPYPKHYDEDDDDVDSAGDSGPGACAKCFYYFLWILAQIALFGAVGLLLFWMLRYDKGFAYQNDRRKQFNLHAFLMLTGFVFVNGQCKFYYFQCNVTLYMNESPNFVSFFVAILIYKTYLCCKKIYNKIAHAFFFVLSIALVAFGMLIGFQAQHAVPPEQSPIHFYSLHSWIGLTAMGLFALQVCLLLFLGVYFSHISICSPFSSLPYSSFSVSSPFWFFSAVNAALPASVPVFYPFT